MRDEEEEDSCSQSSFLQRHQSLKDIPPWNMHVNWCPTRPLRQIVIGKKSSTDPAGRLACSRSYRWSFSTHANLQRRMNRVVGGRLGSSSSGSARLKWEMEKFIIMIMSIHDFQRIVANSLAAKWNRHIFRVVHRIKYFSTNVDVSCANRLGSWWSTSHLINQIAAR